MNQRCCLLCSALALASAGCKAVPENAEILPVKVEIPGGVDLWQTMNFYVSGQPNPRGLEAAKARGVRTVVNLRPEDEIPDFDERKIVEDLALTYVNIPVTSQNLGDAEADQFVAALKSARKQVLIHCASGNRASALWAIYLSMSYGVDPDRAIALAERSGLSSEQLKSFVKDYVTRRKSALQEAAQQKP